MTDAAFDDSGSRRFEDWLANRGKAGLKGGGMAAATTAIAGHINLGPSATMSEAVLKGSANNMISTLIGMGINPDTYNGRWEDIALRVGIELSKSGITGGSDGAVDFLTAPHIAGRKMAKEVKAKGGDEAAQEAAYKQGHDKVLEERVALLKTRAEQKKKDEGKKPPAKKEDKTDESVDLKKEDKTDESVDLKKEDKTDELVILPNKESKAGEPVDPVHEGTTAEKSTGEAGNKKKAHPLMELAKRQQERANAERDAKITSAQKEQFAEIDKLKQLAKSHKDWEYIRQLEHQADRPLSQRTSANDQQAALDLLAHDTNFGVHKDGTPVTAEEHAATIKEMQKDLDPQLDAKSDDHEGALQGLQRDAESQIIKRDKKVRKEIAKKVAAQIPDEDGNVHIAMEGSASLGMGGGGSTGAAAAGPGKRIGIEDASKPELWGTLGHKPAGQEADAITYGTGGITTADIAEHPTAQPARASELALQVAAQREASKIGTLRTKGPVGDLQFTEQLGPDGEPTGYSVGVPVKMGKKNVVLDFQDGVDITSGMGPARELLTVDGDARKAQLTPEHAQKLKAKGQLMSGEQALSRKASDFKGKEVLGIGGGPTSLWAMEHALNGEAKSVEVAASMPRPKQDTPLGKRLAEVETAIRNKVEAEEAVPPELTAKHHQIVAEHVQSQEARLAQIEKELRSGTLDHCLYPGPLSRRQRVAFADRLSLRIPIFLSLR